MIGTNISVQSLDTRVVLHAVDVCSNRVEMILSRQDALNLAGELVKAASPEWRRPDVKYLDAKAIIVEMDRRQPHKVTPTKRRKRTLHDDIEGL